MPERERGKRRLEIHLHKIAMELLLQQMADFADERRVAQAVGEALWRGDHRIEGQPHRPRILLLSQDHGRDLAGEQQEERCRKPLMKAQRGDGQIGALRKVPQQLGLDRYEGGGRPIRSPGLREPLEQRPKLGPDVERGVRGGETHKIEGLLQEGQWCLLGHRHPGPTVKGVEEGKLHPHVDLPDLGMSPK